ncbi:hypothetical protein [Curtobacterium sp. NPDC086286]|jgi:hypothetical protein|uniref:hypothetical protein n=1 Tax=Curtobacterium sp. NPDC086286 TaxID=3363964 RepID=UPI0038139B34
MSLAVFASFRGWITAPDLPDLSKYRYQQVGPGWPDFTLPWEIAFVLLGLAVAMTVWMLRHPAVFKLSYGTTV